MPRTRPRALPLATVAVAVAVCLSMLATCATASPQCAVAGAGWAAAERMCPGLGAACATSRTAPASASCNVLLCRTNLGTFAGCQAGIRFWLQQFSLCDGAILATDPNYALARGMMNATTCGRPTAQCDTEPAFVAAFDACGLMTEPGKGGCDYLSNPASCQQTVCGAGKACAAAAANYLAAFSHWTCAGAVHDPNRLVAMSLVNSAQLCGAP